MQVFSLESSCRTRSKTNKARLQLVLLQFWFVPFAVLFHFWTSVSNNLPVIPSLAAVLFGIHTNIQQTTSTNLSLHFPYGCPEGDMLLTYFTYLKVIERIFVAYLGLPAQHFSLAFIYGLSCIRGYKLFFFVFLLTRNKFWVGLI